MKFKQSHIFKVLLALLLIVTIFSAPKALVLLNAITYRPIITPAQPIRPKTEYVGRKIRTSTVLMYTEKPPVNLNKVVFGMVRNHGTQSQGTISISWDIMWNDIDPLELNDTMRIKVIPVGTQYEIVDQFIVTKPNGYSNEQEQYFLVKDSAGLISECPFKLIEFELTGVDNSFKNENIEWVDKYVNPIFEHIDEDDSVVITYNYKPLDEKKIGTLLSSLHFDTAEARYSPHYSGLCNSETEVPRPTSVITFYTKDAYLTFVLMAKQLKYAMSNWAVYACLPKEFQRREEITQLITKEKALLKQFKSLAQQNVDIQDSILLVETTSEENTYVGEKFRPNDTLVYLSHDIRFPKNNGSYPYYALYSLNADRIVDYYDEMLYGESRCLDPKAAHYPYCNNELIDNDIEFTVIKSLYICDVNVRFGSRSTWIYHVYLLKDNNGVVSQIEASILNKILAKNI